MEVTYKTKKLQKICTDAQKTVTTYGELMSDKIHQRIDEISSAPSAKFMVQNRIGRCHQLQGNRNGEYALDLIHPWRLIFKEEGGSVTIAEIQEIIDYH